MGKGIAITKNDIEKVRLMADANMSTADIAMIMGLSERSIRRIKNNEQKLQKKPVLKEEHQVPRSVNLGDQMHIVSALPEDTDPQKETMLLLREIRDILTVLIGGIKKC